MKKRYKVYQFSSERKGEFRGSLVDKTEQSGLVAAASVISWI